MQKINYLLLCLSIFVTSQSCNQAEKKDRETTEVNVKEPSPEEVKQEALYLEVMEVHDAVMPKTDQLMQLKWKLQEIKESLDPKVDKERIAKIQTGIINLEAADEAMMDWMRNFRKQESSIKYHMEITDYYDLKMQKIEQVRELILNSIENANTLIEEEQ